MSTRKRYSPEYARQALGFYPVSADGLETAENVRSRAATRRRIRGLWNPPIQRRLFSRVNE